MANEMQKTVGLFMEAGRMVRRRLEGEQGPLSFVQFEAMRQVKDQGSLPMRELARLLSVTAPSATALVEDLAERGYLLRAGNPDDRREVILRVTAAGTKALLLATKKRAAVLRTILKGLSAKDHKDLQRIFTKMIKS